MLSYGKQQQGALFLLGPDVYLFSYSMQKRDYPCKKFHYIPPNIHEKNTINTNYWHYFLLKEFIGQGYRGLVQLTELSQIIQEMLGIDEIPHYSAVCNLHYDSIHNH